MHGPSRVGLELVAHLRVGFRPFRLQDRVAIRGLEDAPVGRLDLVEEESQVHLARQGRRGPRHLDAVAATIRMGGDGGQVRGGIGEGAEGIHPAHLAGNPWIARGEEGQ